MIANPSVQGVITDGGGTAPNIIPARTKMDYLVRAPTAADLHIVAEKVTGCFEGAARQTGCKVQVDREVLMFELRNDKALSVSIIGQRPPSESQS